MTVAEVLPDGVVELLAAYLGRQRWYAGSAEADPGSVRVIDSTELPVTEGASCRLLWLLVEAEGARYQLLLGERPHDDPAEFLHGHDAAALGSVGGAYYYDATLDPDLAHAFLAVVTGGDELTSRVRPVSVEQSNTSLVFDDRIILKIFRRLVEGPNPDVEVTTALAFAGFAHVAAPIASWQRDGVDLAFAQQYLAGGSEGWALALTSLRDFYASDEDDPARAGGDFGAEARRLGQMTGEMHLAMARAFEVGRRDDFRAGTWTGVVADVAERLHRLGDAGGAAEAVLERLRAVGDPGPAIRAHGDYHLGQVMRTDSGWYVLDFEGEPARPMAQRLAPTSPFKDVTGMLRSFQYAAHYVLLEREEAEQARIQPMSSAWEAHNRSAFLDGYLTTSGIDQLLPVTAEDRTGVILTFELDKALYELSYEQAYRPAWAEIPRAAIRRLLSEHGHG